MSDSGFPLGRTRIWASGNWNPARTILPTWCWVGTKVLAWYRSMSLSILAWFFWRQSSEPWSGANSLSCWKKTNPILVGLNRSGLTRAVVACSSNLQSMFNFFTNDIVKVWFWNTSWTNPLLHQYFLISTNGI